MANKNKMLVKPDGFCYNKVYRPPWWNGRHKGLKIPRP